MIFLKRSLFCIFVLIVLPSSLFAFGKSNPLIIETDSDYITTWLTCIDAFDSIPYVIDSSDKDSGTILGKMPGGSDSRDSYISVKIREKDNKRVITITNRPGKIIIYIRKSQNPINIYVNSLQENLENPIIIEQE